MIQCFQLKQNSLSCALGNKKPFAEIKIPVSLFQISFGVFSWYQITDNDSEAYSVLKMMRIKQKIIVTLSDDKK